jgi:ubiquinone/menaquinone biosynthesis methyltransferase
VVCPSRGTMRAMTNLRGALASPQTKAPYVRRLFATIADRYDLSTVLLSFGLDRRWKDRLVRLAGIQPGARALDLACGTGDIAFALARAGGHVTGLDITLRMLEIARTKPDSPAVALVGGDMMALPFAGGSFDVVTTGYGIRNVPAIEPAIAEILRVLRPGGVLLSLDFDRPEGAMLRGVYLAYLTVVGSALGWILHRDPDTYRYIPASIARYPGSAALAAMLRRAGFRECAVLPVLGGLMAINTARSPVSGE